MKQIATKDGSITFLNQELNETYHSISGAKEEAVKKFVEPCKKFTNPKILDVCFGLGYNSAAALDYFKECSIVGIEIDENILNKILDINAPFNSYNEIKRAVKGNSSKIKLVIGDFRKVLKKVSETFDIVFFDAFSPKNASELWTDGVFTLIYSKMGKNSILTTYSCSKSVRENMKKAGFIVKDGPIVGRRSPSTIAIKTFI